MTACVAALGGKLDVLVASAGSVARTLRFKNTRSMHGDA